VTVNWNNLKFLAAIVAMLGLFNTSKAQTPCKADFDWNVSGGNVTLSDKSTTAFGNKPELVHWQFGDSSYASGAIANHIYSAPGKYQITQIIYSESPFCYDTLTKEIKIDDGVKNYCKAKFSVKSFPKKKSFEITGHFHDSIQSYDWSFGDSQVMNSNKLIYRTLDSITPGFRIRLKVTGNNCLDSTSTFIFRNIPDCQPYYDYSLDSLTDSISFYKTGSFTSFHNKVEYNWSLSDGTELSTMHSRHRFKEYLRYQSCLTINEPITGCEQSHCDVVNTCQASFKYSISKNNPYKVKFHNQSKAKNMKVYWDWGDGASSEEVSPWYNFGRGDTHNVKLLIMSDSTNCRDSVYTPVGLTSDLTGCKASFEYSTDERKVSFNSVSTGRNLSHTWFIETGDWLKGPSPSYEFDSNDTYQASLFIHDNETGCRDTTRATIKIEVPIKPCRARFTFNLDSSIARTVYVWEQSKGEYLDYTWDFGDGNSANRQFPRHDYTGPGWYNLCLSVRNDSCTDEFCDSFKIDSTGQFSHKKGFFTLIVFGEIHGSSMDVNQDIDETIYPVPFSDVLHIASNEKIQSLMIYNVSGQKMDFEFTDLETEWTIDTSKLKSGLYLIRVGYGNTSTTHKLIKH